MRSEQRAGRVVASAAAAMWARFREDTRLRRVALALALWALATLVYFACAARDRWLTHTPYNHFALLAEAWLRGGRDVGAPPPTYAGNNDFAEYQGRWYIVFPAFPAVLLLPVVKLAGSSVEVRDGQFFLWLAGIAPAALFLALERLRLAALSTRSTRVNWLLAAVFAFGTVYWFTAEQGTVWFAAHVVGTALAALYLLFSIEARSPWLAGLCLGCGYLTRSPLLFAAPFFVLEAWRTRRDPTGKVALGTLARALAGFGVPLLVALGLAALHNRARFGDAGEFGYRFLTVAWAARMEKWGLFGFHYLGKNLAVVLTALPFHHPNGQPAPFQINGHGLALWITTPMYLWLLWPKQRAAPSFALWITALAVAVPTLFYHNTGWLQYGYRFSNDYAPFLFALLAIGGRRFGAGFVLACAFALVVNGFGALTFQRAGFSRFYFVDPTQKILHQPD